MSDSRDVLININGLVIKTNSIYKITNKLDNNAPSGFRKEGTTKLPSAGIGNTVGCRFKIVNDNTKEGIYDTGFYEESPCYALLTDDEVKSKVKTLQEKIVQPYERRRGKKGLLDHSNSEFWDSFGVDLFDGRFLVTSNPDDLLDLYIAMLSYDLTPKEVEGDPKFRNSQYCIEDKEKVQNIKTERANLMVEAISNFGRLLSEDRNTLLNILRYIRIIGIADEIDNSTLNALFFEWLNKDTENPKRFKKTYDLTQNDKTADEVNLFAIISRLAVKNLLDKNGGEYTYKGKVLGADLKTAAKNINSKTELEEIKIELIEMD